MKDNGQSYIIQNDAIGLRYVRLSDVNERYHHWMNDPEVTQFLETRFSPYPIDKIRNYVETMASRQKDEPFFAIIIKKEKAHIGNIKLGPINWYHLLADVSLVIGDKSFWGKGIGAQAIELVTRYAFDTLKLHKLTAGLYAGNIGSEKAFLKAGFSLEAVLPKQRFYKGGYVDEKRFGIISDFPALPRFSGSLHEPAS